MPSSAVPTSSRTGYRWRATGVPAVVDGVTELGICTPPGVRPPGGCALLRAAMRLSAKHPNWHFTKAEEDAPPGRAGRNPGGEAGWLNASVLP